MVKTGIELIKAERKRQVTVEGFCSVKDDCNVDGEMALVAALYASPIQLFTLSLADDRKNERRSYRGAMLEADDPWPASWGQEWDKRHKHDRIRQLTIAGALIAAEIDRLLRLGDASRAFTEGEG